jgi:hydrogenase nickel incorporation protein HypA/HybF
VHELSVAIELLRAARAEADARGGGRIESLRVEVGELSGVEPELLATAFEAVAEDGPDAGAALTIDWIPSRQTCPGCGPIAERQPGRWLRLCPRCAGPLLVQGGDELDLVRLVVAQPDPLPT